MNTNKLVQMQVSKSRRRRKSWPSDCASFIDVWTTLRGLTEERRFLYSPLTRNDRR
jgi:hypothetical protein